MNPDKLQQHLNKFVNVSDAEFSEILPYFKPVSVRKKENLQEEGRVCRSIFFVLNGCLRKFFINAKGVEQTTEFAIENWWMTDQFAYERQVPTDFYIQAVEPSQVLSLDFYAQEKLLQQFPQLERYFRYVYQRAFAAAQMRIKFLYDLSREELYRFFLQQQPQFAQRIPQYLLASYLGITPEYLSEIRNKLRSQ